MTKLTAIPLPPAPKDDLSERLKRLDTRSAELHAELDLIDEERDLISKLRDLERRKAAVVAGDKQDPIPVIMAKTLLKGPSNKERLKEKAEAQGHHAPGRSIHAILMNYIRHGHVVVNSDGGITLTEKGADALRQEAEGAN